MSKNYIFCFSGSGNCLDIAKNIAAELGDTDIVMMRRRPAITDVSGAERVGFVFPCYAGGLPGDVAEYVRGISFSPDCYTFGVVSYAGYPGIGLAEIDKIRNLDYHSAVSHQCSCIWLFPHSLMLPIMTGKKAQKRSEELAKKIGQAVLNKEKSPKSPSAPFLNKIESSVWPKLAAAKAEKLTVSGKCIGCGQCAGLCPKGNIRLSGGRPVFGSNCIGCLSCLQYCPTQAINMGGVTVSRERYHNPNVEPAELNKSIIHID